ncbi:hypothetical protein [Vibrio sp. RE86]|uniref:hypothetical protein n=1 Tax=Vibrio sp. RE86 TaxID=2607605 RepID=UPI001493C7AA|nr:hypothetical protein [Vibrio sp. RE86]
MWYSLRRLYQAYVQIFATTFAILIYLNWKNQQSEVELMNLRKRLLVILISMEKASTRLLLCYKMSEIPREKDHLESQISSLCADFRSELILFYMLDTKGKEEVSYASSLTAKGDFLDTAKVLYKLCDQLYWASSHNIIYSSLEDSGTLRALTVGSGYLGPNTYPELSELLSNLGGRELSNLLSKSAIDISQENAKTSI